MHLPRPHRVIPALIMSAAATVPGASAALIMVHAGRSSTIELASAVTPVASSSGESAAIVSTTRKSPAAATPTPVPGTHRKKVATVHTPKVVLPTATAQPTATLQSSTLQAQSSSSTDVVSGATGQ